MKVIGILYLNCFSCFKIEKIGEEEMKAAADAELCSQNAECMRFAVLSSS